MSSTAEVQFVGSASQLLAEYDKLKAKNEQLARDLRAVGQSSKSANADQKQLAREAKAAIESTLTPLERYRKQMEQLKAALRDGLITQEQFNRANRQAHTDLQAAKEAADSYGRAAKKTFEETRTPLEKHNAQMARLRELLAKGRIDQDTFNRAAKRQGDILKSTQPTLAAHAAEIGKAALGFAGIGSATAGIMLAAQAIKAEYDALLDRQKQALGEQQTHGQAFRKTLTAFIGDESIGDSQALNAEIQRVAKSTGTPAPIVDRVAESALSSKGSLTNKQAMGAVEEALRLLPGDEGAALSTSGVILELAQQTDVKDAKSLAGFVTQAKAATKITNDQSFGQSFTAGTLSAMVRGDSPEQAAEVFATVGNLMGDKEGMRTRTATIQLAEQLAESFPELPSTSARISHLQKNPQAAEGFLSGANFEASAQAFMEKLLRGTPDAIAIQEAARRDIAPLGPDSAAAWEQKLADINSDPTQRVNAVGTGVASSVDKFQRTDANAAMAAQVREMLVTGDEALANQFNFPSVADDFSLMGVPIGDRAVVASRLETRLGRGDDPVQAGLAAVDDIEGMFQPAPGRNSRPLNQDQLNMLREIRDVLHSIDRKPASGGPPAAGLGRNN